METESVLERIDHAAALAWLQKAIRTPSVTGNETAFGDLVASELVASGADRVEIVEVGPGRPIVWSVTHGTGEHSPIMLASHLDTVEPSLPIPDDWTGTQRADPFSAAIVDGAVWGLGAGDTKAGIATTMAALRTLHDAGARPLRDVVTLWAPDEEAGVSGRGQSVGMRKAITLMADGRIPHPDFAIYHEPTDLAVFTAQIGFIVADVSIQGEAAYFAYPERGIDALRAAHAVLNELWRLDRDLRSRGQHPPLGTAQLLVTTLRSGGTIAVPGTAQLSLIRSVLPHEDLDVAAMEIADTVFSAVEGTGADAEVAFTSPRDHCRGGCPAQTSLDTPGVDALRAAVEAVAPNRANLGAARYWSEASLLTAADIPTVYWGPGDITNCHTAQEHVDIQDFRVGVEALTRFLHAS
jgi:acetylornithine deacetylase